MNPLKLSARWIAATVLAAAPWAALAQSDAYVCGVGINDGGTVQHLACYANDTGAHTEGSGTVTRPYAVTVGGSGEYREGTWSNAQAADLATGVMRSSLLYASGPDDLAPYLLNTYLDIWDTLTFSGSGSATFVMHLTGRFPGEGHALYANGMDTSLDLTRVGTGYPDVLGRIHLEHRSQGTAQFTSGTTCGAAWFALGDVSCEVRSLDAQGVDIVLSVTIDDVRDGEVYWFRSSLNVQAYGPRMGGSDFGNTARLGVLLSDGLSFSSASGVLLTEALPVPEPGSWALMLAGLVFTAGAWRRRCAAAR